MLRFHGAHQGKKLKKLIVSAAVAALVSACGGGGDGCDSCQAVDFNPTLSPENRPSVALSALTYEAAGKELLGGVSNVMNITDSIGFLTGAEMARGMTFPQFVQLKYPQVLRAVKKPAYLTGASLNELEPCSGGGFTTLTGYVRNDHNLTPGDTFTMTAVHCREGGVTVSGSLSIRLTAVTGNIDGYPFSMGLESSTNDFRATTTTATFQSTGSMTMGLSTAGERSLEWTYTTPSMVSSVFFGAKSETFRYNNYTLTASLRGDTTSVSFNGSLNVPSLGGNLVAVRTVQPLVSTGRYPVSGAVIATTALGGTVWISAAPASQALIELDANSDGAYETGTLVPWSAVF